MGATRPGEKPVPERGQGQAAGRGQHGRVGTWLGAFSLFVLRRGLALTPRLVLSSRLPAILPPQPPQQLRHKHTPPRPASGLSFRELWKG